MKTSISLFFALLIFTQNLTADSVVFESSEAQVGLLELYTSEGCSSCPPADRWLTTLQQHPGVWQNFIPIALHVDYWDYIGWNDRFASGTHSKRQRRYAAEQSLKAVYTPGFVYNGKEWRQWYSNRKAEFPTGDRPGVMRLQVEGSIAQVQFTPSNPAAVDETLRVNLALLGFGLETDVRAGENRGKKLPHNFVVLGMRQASIKGKEGNYNAELKLPRSDFTPENTGVVAWLSSSQLQRPIQAVGGLLPES